MALGAGDRLGPYEITGQLGKGGMGEVWKARDTRLDRSVAVKVLPDHIAQREDARARFEREARAVASLNHPNVCVLHDIGPNYMVMELIDGETLADRIAKGPIPLEQALTWAIQIADALDRAHRAGVTHRDIKPGNIMLTRDGVKVLDFGLAKSAASSAGPSEATLTKAITTEGAVVGTPQYMAPEQFEGKEADARSDIWAFGAVLYEMATGQKAFQGKNYTSLVAAILGGEPAPMAVKTFTPAWLERLVRRCLQKDPEDRWQTMRDVVIDLKSPPAAVASIPTKPSRWWQAIAAVSILTAAIAAGWGLWLRSRAEPPRQVRLEIAVPPSRSIGRFVSLSPDGRTLAWADDANVYVREMDGFEPRVLAPVRLDGYIFWSPDSKQLGFRTDGMLKRISVAGGPVLNICEARSVLGAVWTKEDVLILGSSSEGLLRVPVSGGEPEPVKVAGAPAKTAWMTWPVLLSGGKKLMYMAQSPQRPPALMVASLQSDGSLSSPRQLLPGAFGAQYITDAAGRGHILFIRGTSLMAQAFDPDSLMMSGDPQVVTNAIGIYLTRAFFAAADGGAIAFRSDDAEGPRPEFVDRSGKGEVAKSVSGTTLSLSLSPDGRGILAQVTNENNFGTIWVLDPERGAHTRVTFDDTSARFPIWSPDGKRIAYEAGGLWIKPINGTGAAEMLGPAGTLPWSWSHDGRHLLVSVLEGTAVRPGLFVVSLNGDRRPSPYLESKFAMRQAQFSPDDRWVAYISEESGDSEVYVRRFPDTGEQIRISNSGGAQPRWSRDGRELFYVETRSGRLMSVALRYAKTLEVDAPKPLFDTRLPAIFGLPTRYDVTPDGKRFIVARNPESQGPNPLRVILNWRGATK